MFNFIRNVLAATGIIAVAVITSYALMNVTKVDKLLKTGVLQQVEYGVEGVIFKCVAVPPLEPSVEAQERATELRRDIEPTPEL